MDEHKQNPGKCITIDGIHYFVIGHCRQLKVVIVETSNNKVK